MNVNLVGNHLGVTFVTANRFVEKLVELGILREVTGGRRSRIFRYGPYLALFADEGLVVEDPTSETTQAPHPNRR